MARMAILGCMLLMAGCSAQSTQGPSDEPQVGQRKRATNDGVVRKIIHKAEVVLVVSDFSKTEDAVPRLVKQHGGYLAHVRIDRTSGEHRKGNWQARIPVAQFDSFLNAVATLGVPKSRSQTAQEVTEEFVDLEARIANKQRLEKRLLELLGGADREIRDVIDVEHELARVRGDIEQMQGRLRYLDNRTELTTVDIHAREQRDYVPPETPTFLARTTAAWGNSLLSLQTLGEAFAVAVVYFFPWLLTLSVLAAPPLWYARHHIIRAFKSAKG